MLLRATRRSVLLAAAVTMLFPALVAAQTPEKKKVTIAVGAQVKRPGELMQGEETELSFLNKPEGDEMDAYERLLGDAIHGDAALFARQDAV